MEIDPQRDGELPVRTYQTTASYLDRRRGGCNKTNHGQPNSRNMGTTDVGRGRKHAFSLFPRREKQGNAVFYKRGGRGQERAL